MLTATTTAVGLACTSLFIDHFSAPKWILLLLLLPLFCAMAAFRADLRVPRLPTYLTATLAFLAFWFFLSPLARPAPYLLPLLSGANVLLLFLVCLPDNRFLAAYSRGMEIAITLTLIYAALQLLKLDPFPFLYRGESVGPPDSFFGNSAMAAEFAGLAAIALWQFRTSPHRARPLLLLLTLAFLFLQRTRAAPLSLAVTFLVFRFPWRKIRETPPIRVLIGTIAIITIAVVFVPFRAPEKILSANARIARWSNTLALISENPLGIGAGSFQGRYLDFYRRVQPDVEVTEYSMVTHPHNELLRFTVEQGWPWAALLLVLGIALLFSSSRAPPLARETLLFLFLQSLVQGTLLNAPSALAFTIALSASLPRNREGRLMPRSGRWLAAGLALALLLPGLWFAQAKALESHPERYGRDELIHGCTRFPSIWRLCLKAAERSLSERIPDQAITPLKAVIAHDRNQFPTWKMLAVLHGALGNREEACASLQEYERIFFYSTRHSERYRQLCGSAR